MKNIAVKSIVSTALLAVAGVSFAQSGPANAYGVVISSTPVVQQVTVPKQVCTTSTVQYVQPSGGGALLGAVIGGVVGNQFGRGQGRAVATAAGALGGGLIGNQVEAQNGYYAAQPVQQCHTQNTLENQTVAQNVLYEYAGQRFNVQMPANGDFRPGSRIALQVSAPAPVQAPVQQTYYSAPEPTVTYVNTVAPVVYYETYDGYRPRYYRSTYYGPRASHTAVQPVQPVRNDWHREHRDWRY
jgi:uncharacterized protein YcfJ